MDASAHTFDVVSKQVTETRAILLKRCKNDPELAEQADKLTDLLEAIETRQTR